MSTDTRSEIPCIAASLVILENISIGIIDPDVRIKTYIIEDMAICYWLDGIRPSDTLSLIFSRRPVLEPGLTAPVMDAQGKQTGEVRLDCSFDSFFSLLHPAYAERARLIARLPAMDVFVLAPEDIILMKMALLSERDGPAIVSLARKGLLDLGAIELLTEEALERYVGCRGHIRQNLQRIGQMLRECLPPDRAHEERWRTDISRSVV